MVLVNTLKPARPVWPVVKKLLLCMLRRQADSLQLLRKLLCASKLMWVCLCFFGWRVECGALQLGIVREELKFLLSGI